MFRRFAHGEGHAKKGVEEGRAGWTTFPTEAVLGGKKNDGSPKGGGGGKRT